MPTINGTAGDDTLTGTDGDDEINGLGGNDFLRGWEGDDTLDGGDGDDILYGDYGFNLGGTYEFTGNDVLFGGQGDDQLYGGAGSDTMHGGAGNDSYGVNEESDVVVEADGEGVDGVTASISYTLGANVENLGIWGEDLIGTGNELNNILSGSSSQPHRNTLYGLGGNDLLIGYGGDDYLDGGSGNDTLQGGEGRDTMLGGDGGDFLWALFGGADILTGGAGVDIFYGRVSELNGATITDLEVGDRIVFAGEGVEYFPFEFHINGNTLNFTGGSMTLENLPPGTHLVVTPTPLPGYHYNGFAAYRYELTLIAHDPRNDFNGDGRSDVLWRHNGGTITDWLATASGGFANNHGNAAALVPTDWDVVGSGDFNGDGRDDVLWRHVGGTITDWLATASGGFANNHGNAGALVPNDWKVVGTGDFNGDGRDDILWRHDGGTITDWLGTGNGGFANNHGNAGALVPPDWNVVGVGDFNGDGRDDILWRHDGGMVTDWLGTPTGGFLNNHGNAAAVLANEWEVLGTGDFNGDGRDDILLGKADGSLASWLGEADGGFIVNSQFQESLGAERSVAAIGDYNSDGIDDLLLRHDDGTIDQWLGNASGAFGSNPAFSAIGVPNDWHVQVTHLDLI